MCQTLFWVLSIEQNRQCLHFKDEESINQRG